MMKQQIKVLNKKLMEDEGSAEDIPFLFVCGLNEQSSSLVGGPITYDRIVIDHTNIDSPGGLNITSGEFTAPISGIYSVTYAVVVEQEQDATTYVGLRKDGQVLYDIEHNTYTDEYDIEENLARTLPIFLAKGETPDLYCQSCQSIMHNTFCLTLEREVVP